MEIGKVLLPGLSTEPLDRFLIHLVLDELALPLGVHPNVVLAPGEGDEEVESEADDAHQKTGDVARSVLRAEAQRPDCKPSSVGVKDRGS